MHVFVSSRIMFLRVDFVVRLVSRSAQYSVSHLALALYPFLSVYVYCKVCDLVL